MPMNIRNAIDPNVAPRAMPVRVVLEDWVGLPSPAAAPAVVIGGVEFVFVLSAWVILKNSKFQSSVN